ncbi:hypothetical protein DAPPUDRAFT_311023 [Daphnia pulex]|uniref:Uncharacterized protein n=1 Tax=Daphnia pulex TaxID=6669 RepID=E9FUD8_DAPPU|nr:hypothetical protein DAPPUDRAFT_311023 [Daphnia pulex]|eukprot:EFX88708.1 hypothetical protein DAPPUDRAFT_311023 [Daphnia pulex]
MKTELILLLIHLVSLTLAAVVPAADNEVTAVVITSTESVESAESIESIGSNDPKVISGTPIEKNKENESAESTESIVSAESTDSPLLDNNVLNKSV